MASKERRPSRDRGGRPRTAPPRRGSDRGSNASEVSGSRTSRGSRTERRPRTPESYSSRGSDLRRSKSQDARSGRGVERGGTGDGRYNPVHRAPKDINQHALNSAPHMGGRLPNGRLLSGLQPDGMTYTPRAGYSRTQFGGMWEDHKTEDRPTIPQSDTRCGLSDFGHDEPHECSTYAYHFGLTFDGKDTMGHMKPNFVGTSTALRGVNGYGRSCNGGFFMREQLGEMKKYNHTEAYRAMPAWARGIPEPTRPGCGFTRTDQGGFFRT